MKAMGMGGWGYSNGWGIWEHSLTTLLNLRSTNPVVLCDVILMRVFL